MDRIIIMPGQTEMTQALISVHDEPHAIGQLYPAICKKLAGQELIAQGVVLGLTLAIHDYSQGMPPIVERIVLEFVPKYIEAIIPDDEVRREAIDIYMEAVAATS